jgi:hypothetical protein
LENNLAPIVLFVYNRPVHTKQTIEALQKNHLAKESELFIYSDGPKNADAQRKVDKVREYIKTIKGFKKIEIIERERNWGLANSVINGVSKIINEYEKVIVLEDDILTSTTFLKFMNEGLSFYKNNEAILSITGFSFEKKFMNFEKNYNLDIYIHKRPMSWSWGTWKSRWNKVDWTMKYFHKFISTSKEMNKFNEAGNDLTNMLINQKAGIIDSWYIRWCMHGFINNQNTIYPVISLVNNIGHDDSGTHSKKNSKKIYDHKELSIKDNFSFNNSLKLDKKILKNYNKAFNMRLRGLLFLKLKLLLKLDKRLIDDSNVEKIN